MSRKNTKVLFPNFFTQSSVQVARSILGKVLIRRTGTKTLKMLITESEAYGGQSDLASHARFGRTRRNEIMFEEGGHWYVYLVYGIHWLLNIISGPKGKPSGVLIRSGVLLDSKKVLGGPGVVTKTLRISGHLTGKRSDKKSGLWIEDWNIKIPKRLVKTDRRIGVEYAGKWAKKRWRFFIDANSLKNDRLLSRG